MSLKIQKAPKTSAPLHTQNAEWDDFIMALKKVKPGECFVALRYPSNYRLAVSIAQRLFDATYYSRKLKDGGYRIVRES